MKKPDKAPPFTVIFDELLKVPRRLSEVLDAVRQAPPSGRYLHWDKLSHYKPPANLTHREWWLGLKYARLTLSKRVPLVDKADKPFQYVLADPIPERLHDIDLRAGGQIQMPAQITNPETKDRYYVGSLIEEAITSSQLEGATTTRRVAKDMLRAGRPPRDRSERMILNNFLTMKRIGEIKHESLTKELVFDLHRLVTEDTLDDPSAAGRFRRPDEPVVVGDDYGEVFHDPPSASQLDNRLSALCDFANGNTPTGFIHPTIRSIILHFWLSYDHPFLDGNGRTARALFYWSMLHHGYWLCEFISISHIILKGPAKYGMAFLYTETDDNDLTYFILYHVDIISRAIDELHEYIRRKSAQLEKTERELRGMRILNYRQRTLISHAMRHPSFQYSIAGHQASHNVVYQTARTDLLDLVDRGLLSSEKIGRTWYFTPVVNLEEKLRAMN